MNGKHSHFWHQCDKASNPFRQHYKWFENSSGWQDQVNVHDAEGRQCNKTWPHIRRHVKKKYSHTRPSKTNHCWEFVIGFLTRMANRGSHLNTRENLALTEMEVEKRYTHAGTNIKDLQSDLFCVCYSKSTADISFIYCNVNIDSCPKIEFTYLYVNCSVMHLCLYTHVYKSVNI